MTEANQGDVDGNAWRTVPQQKSKHADNRYEEIIIWKLRVDKITAKGRLVGKRIVAQMRHEHVVYIVAATQPDKNGERAGSHDVVKQTHIRRCGDKHVIHIGLRRSQTETDENDESIQPRRGESGANPQMYVARSA